MSANLQPLQLKQHHRQMLGNTLLDSNLKHFIALAII